MTPNPESLGDFSGVARLFPLPDLVLFPSVVQPLHVFEARYRQMMADALADDRLLTIVLLKPGWEEDYHQKPAVHPVACVGRIHKEQRLADGRYNLLLHGLARVRLGTELVDDRLYRTARADLLADVPAPAAREGQLRESLARRLPPCFDAPGGAEQAAKLFASPLALGALCDIFSFALPLEADLKQQLLEELDVTRRVARLLAAVDGLAPSPEPAQTFPPPFSAN